MATTAILADGRQIIPLTHFEILAVKIVISFDVVAVGEREMR